MAPSIDTSFSQHPLSSDDTLTSDDGSINDTTASTVIQLSTSQGYDARQHLDPIDSYLRSGDVDVVPRDSSPIRRPSSRPTGPPAGRELLTNQQLPSRSPIHIPSTQPLTGPLPITNII